MIPNRLVREKIVEIILKAVNANRAETEKIQEIFDTAKETGEQQEILRYLTDCNDPKEECSTDIVVEYAMPDGTKKIERNHTW
jgi:predicted house-cleaning noncanonical NTP pyrophosphatase (MazG superfamily)